MDEYRSEGQDEPYEGEQYDFEHPILAFENDDSEEDEFDESGCDDKDPVVPITAEPDPELLAKIAGLDEYIQEKKEKMMSIVHDPEVQHVVTGGDNDVYEELFFKHLDVQEALVILPAALKLAIKHKEVDSQLFQKKLGLSFVKSYKVLKELKRVHVILRADGVKPRKVRIKTAIELLKQLQDYMKYK